MVKHKSDFTGAFCKAINDTGLTPPRVIIADGKTHRFASNGQRGDDAGWYIFRNGKIPTGRYGCWRLGKSFSWQADMGKPLTATQQAELKAELESLRKLEEIEKTKSSKDAQLKAQTIIKSAIQTKSHPYLERKQVSAHGVYTYKDMLIVPMRDAKGVLHSLQFIDADGSKRFLSGGRTSSCYHLIGKPTNVLCIAEGYATGATIHEVTGYAVAVAFNAGNLIPVTKLITRQYPNIQVVICADDDWQTDGNPGFAKALEASRASNALVATPVFGEERGKKDTDFNDMALAAGRKAVKTCITQVVRTGVSSVAAVTSSKSEGLSATANDTVKEAGVTDATEDAWATEQRPCFKVLEFDEVIAERPRKAGVWWLGMKSRSGTTFPVESWVSSPIYVDAITHDAQENNFGRLLRFRNSLGHWRSWAMPMEMLRGTGEELRGELLNMGVHLSQASNMLLGGYLLWGTPGKQIRCATQVGWCGDSFVLPDTVIGANASSVIFQSGERGQEEHTQAGNLEGWKELVSARAVGNPLLVLAISAAFAGPLLQKCNAESGGLHFVGDSSTGKTTAIEAACSVWGGRNFRRSWRATSNGMEGVAALFNDCLLALDEISECDPREVGAIVYALGNGRGKQRASRTGSARSITRWLCSVLSSGERTIATTMADGGYRIKAGQAVRLLDVPAIRIHGAWDDLHGFSNGAEFSDAIRNAVVGHHGVAGRAFLEKLTRDAQNFSVRLEQIKTIPAFFEEPGQGQDKRVAARFALIGMAGEIATEYGLTDWPTGEALAAAVEALRAWHSMRGGSGNDEKRKIPEQVLAFLERHGDSRFSKTAREHGEMPTRDRAGWWEDNGNKRIYYFTADGMREATKGHDFGRALDVLQEMGALTSKNGERAQPKRINGRMVRVYAVSSDMLGVSSGVATKARKSKEDTLVTAVTPIIKSKPRKFQRERNQ